jgi:KDO2-lipid IV(A) lauroyltransferase
MLTAFYIIINFLSYLLPMRCAYFITKGISAATYFIIYRRARENVRNNLIRVFGAKVEKWKLDRMVFETFQNFALFMYEFLITRRLNEKTQPLFVKPVGFEKVDKALENGKGGIMITGHMGNWEWGAAMLTYLGHPATVIANRFKNEFITKFYYDRRVQQGMEVAYLDEAVRKTLRKVKRNGLVAILADRDYTRQGMEVEFFGMRTKIPTGGLLLGLRSGAAVFPAFSIRIAPCRYHVFFDEPLQLESKGYREEDMKKDMQKWVTVLEKYIRKYPTQWYRFEPFWEPEKE